MKSSQVVVLLFSLIIIILVDADDNCQSPDPDRTGVCKPISDCPSLNHLIQHSARNRTITDFLRKSLCGWSGTIPKVCCVSGKLNLPTTNTTNEGVLKNDLLPDHHICGQQSEFRLLEGETAPIDKYPWNALLTYKTADGGEKFYCAGTLFSERYILTAAHCVNGPSLPNNTKLTSVRLGEHNIVTNPDCETYFPGDKLCVDLPIDIPIEQTIVHEDYKPDDTNQYNDIALLRLQSRVKFTEFVRPVCLPATTNNFTGKLLHTTGWGIYDNKIKYTEKKNVAAVVNDKSNCEEDLNVQLNQNQLCVNKPRGHRLCADDSGGFLLDSNLVDRALYTVGVMSFGSCNIENHPRVYTKVDQYSSWIVSKLRP